MAIVHGKRTDGPVDTVSRSTDVQHVEYKVMAEVDDELVRLDRYFIGGNTSWKIDACPSMQLKFSDKDFVLSHPNTGLAPPNRPFWIVVSASTVSDGVHYTRLGEGLVEKYSRNLSPDGVRTITMEAYANPEFRHAYVSPNQTEVGDCNMVILFRGRGYSYDGNSEGTAWNSDSQGNYPNGLLYDTGLSYRGVSDLFEGIPDVPLRTSYGSEKKIGFIRNILKNYGMNFIVDSRAGSFGIRFAPSIEQYPLPYYSDILTLSVGESVNEYSDVIDLTSFNSSVMVVGEEPNIFYKYGSGPKEGFYADLEIISKHSAMKEAVLRYSSSRTPIQTTVVKCAPETDAIPGLSGYIYDPALGAQRHSVVEVRQNFEVDRWNTEVVFDRPEYDAGKSVVEIMDELSKVKESEMSGISYIRATSGISKYGRSSGDSNICAIGFGAGSNSSYVFQTSSGMTDPLIIKAVEGVLTNDLGETAYKTAYASLFPSEANRLIREVVLFANDGEYNEPSKSSFVVPWSRKTAEWNSAEDMDPLMSVSYCPDKYLITVDKISLSSRLEGCVPFVFTPRTADVVRVISSGAGGESPVHPTSTVGGGDNDPNVMVERSVLLSSEEKSLISKDLKLYSTDFGIITVSNRMLVLDVDGEETEEATTSGENVQLFMEFSLPMTDPSRVNEFLKKISFGTNAYARYTATDITDPYYPVRVSGNAILRTYIFLPGESGSIAGGEWTNYNAINANTTVYASFARQTTEVGWHPLLADDQGRLRFALVAAVPAGYASPTVSMFVGYVGLVADMRYQTSTEEEISEIFFEKAYIGEDGIVKTTYPANDVYAIYAAAAESPRGDLWVESPNQRNLLAPGVKYSDPLAIWKPGRIRKYKDLNAPANWLGLQENTAIGNTLWPKDITRFYLDNFKYGDADDAELKEIFKDIWTNGYVFVRYESVKVNPNVPIPETLDTTMFSVSYTPGMGGSRSDFYMHMDSAPPYAVDIVVNYSAVGGGAVGKCVCSMSRNSSLREGFDKTPMKTAYLQYDWYPYTESIGAFDGVGDNPVADTGTYVVNNTVPVVVRRPEQIFEAYLRNKKILQYV